MEVEKFLERIKPHITGISEREEKILFSLARHAVELAYVVEDFDNQKECEALKAYQQTTKQIGEL